MTAFAGNDMTASTSFQQEGGRRTAFTSLQQEGSRRTE